LETFVVYLIAPFPYYAIITTQCDAHSVCKAPLICSSRVAWRSWCSDRDRLLRGNRTVSAAFTTSPAKCFTQPVLSHCSTVANAGSLRLELPTVGNTKYGLRWLRHFYS